ncbi:hypothetical protein [Labrys sp. ZIDIC5]|uniref:hypothetical protein n=1 Tax=Labrys sedimenti TaxID=3106036 RepID=UPI002ACADB01|nr:hypothetical protein [Labrys sp. ZIDIC5]MDZ5448969.1 hypothetical protein [Labrys sp. ZIDIC5]
MPFVQRENGAIVGVYANEQSGYAEEWLEVDDAEVVAFLASIVPKLTVIYKADIWRRATEEEAEIIDAQLNSQPIRLRRMWQDSQTLATTDEMYASVKSAFESAFGAERAAQLLEPTA